MSNLPVPPKYTYTCENCFKPRHVGQPVVKGSCECGGVVSMPNLLTALRASREGSVEAAT